MNNTIIQHSKEDVKQMTNQELVETSKKYNKKWNILEVWLRKHNPNLLDEIISRTNFLNSYPKYPLKSRLYCLEHELKEHPKCSNNNCSNPTRWVDD